MTGALILLVFFVFAALMYARVLPALLAVPAMAILMAAVAGVPASGIGGIVVTGAASLAPVYVAVIFGAMLGRVTLDCGIARKIVNFAAEFGGEQPLPLALLLCAVVALLFVSLSGLGAIIMVGSIVLPIMMTTGVPRKIAATLFLMAFALGFIFNIVNWKFYTQYFGVQQGQLYHYAILLALLDAIALVAYAAISFSRSRAYATWALPAPREESHVPALAVLTPVLPILLYFVLHLDPLIAFPISAIFGVLIARPRRAVQTLAAAAIRGVEDVAPAIVLFVGIGMLLTATRVPQFSAAIRPLIDAGLVRSPIAFVVLFGLLSPLVLYRGPLNPFGVGIAVFTVLLATHALPAVIVVAAMMAVVQVQNVCDPTNTANVWVANYTGVPIVEITKRTLPYQVAVATAACIAIVAGSLVLFGGRAFAFVLPRADAAPAATLFAPASSANRFAVGSDGSPDARGAVNAAVSALRAAGLHAFTVRSDSDSGCSAKTYVAFVEVTSTRFALVEGTDLDIGVRLYDCGGWEADEWHDHAIVSPAASADALARQGIARMLAWGKAHRQRWQHLCELGLAYTAGQPPTYYYSLYKTVDGNMRAYVRAGGPAYAAGLRTGDIVEDIDGRAWWEYGTFQSQARAYDGKPHAFAVERGGRTIRVSLGEPFTV